MPGLILGPLLRYVGETEATVWVETDGPCEVEVLGHRSRTFQVAGHHYAIVIVEGLSPGSARRYWVALDGVQRWPPAGSAPSEIRTLAPGQEVRFVFGSCRVAVPQEPPYTLGPDENALGVGVDALHALGLRLRSQPGASRPDLLLLIGDQVYADELSPAMARLIRERRDVREPPGEEVADFEEYTQLYREAWSDPPLRWLLSTLPTAMIFDDHDLHDDWNTSEAWMRQMRAEPWWEQRIAGAFMSYWIYQHLGNLSPRELANDRLFQLLTAGEDGTEHLHAFALHASHHTDGSLWSYARQVGNCRVVVIDSRAGRVLGGGRRSMLDEEEWTWLERSVTGDVDHLLLVTSLPLLLPRAVHDLEAWNEAVCAGAWGQGPARIGERIRQRLDLEHWAAFQESFTRLVRIIQEVAAGKRGRPPATIDVLSGDVHHAYLAQAWFGDDSSVESLVYQVVCSPIRNLLDSHERRAVRASFSGPAAVVTRALARATGVAPPGIGWRLEQPPTFDNQLATLALQGRRAQLRIEKATGDWREPELATVLDRRLA